MRRILLAAAIAATIAAPTLAASPIGQVVGNGARVDGVSVPSGTTLYSPARVTTAGGPVVLHLSNGQSLNVSENTVAQLHATAGAGVALRVAEGNIALRDPLTSAMVSLAASSQLLLNSTGQINEGTQVDTVAICQPVNGSYELVQIPASQVDQAIADGAVMPGSEPGVDATCDDDDDNNPIGAPAGSGSTAGWAGLSQGTKTAILVGGGLATAGAGYLIVDELDDDDDDGRPVSPIF